MIQDVFCPKNREDFRKWLFENHNTLKGIWIVFYKKSSKKFNLLYSEARDEALCFGWIDSTVKKIDEESRKQYFSPRRKKSKWSKFNVIRAENLIKEGIMTEYGLKAIEAAKKNGTYFIYNKQN